MSHGVLMSAGLLGLGLLAVAWLSHPTPHRQGGKEMNHPLGPFFTWAEVVASATAKRLGLDNTPPPEVAKAIRAQVTTQLDPLRRLLGQPIIVKSWYRSRELNSALHAASPTSQHMLGEAVDFIVPGVPSKLVAAFIVRSGLPFDQVIWYSPMRGGHVHLSYTTRRDNRRQALHAPIRGGYEPFIP